MGMSRMVGLIVLVLGVALLLIGMNMADSAWEQTREAFTGKFSDSTQWYILGGIVMAVLGSLLAMFGGKARA